VIRIDSLRQELQSTQFDILSDRLADLNLASALVRPGDQGHSVIRTNYGNLTVQLVDVTPYADGSRATLRFGNPMSGTLTGMSASLYYGAVNEFGVIDPATSRTKTVSFTESFPGGRWTEVVTVLEGVPPTGLGAISLTSFSVEGITLLR
jgi:hypothetical protein